MIDKHGRITQDKITSTGYAPGYRDFGFEIVSKNGEKRRINLSVDDSLSLVRSILEMHDLAWDNQQPIDSAANEIQPLWINEFPNRPAFRRLYEK